MKRELVLHIGLPKCGSTYIQRVLLNNQAALGEAGVSYPHEGTSHPGNGLGFQRTETSKLEALFANKSRLIISYEDLVESGKNIGPLANAVETLGVEVTIVALIRPFSEWLFGDYSQRMKQHFDRYLATRIPYDGMSLFDLAARRAKQLQPAKHFKEWLTGLPQAKFELARQTDIRPTFEKYFNGASIDWTVPLRQVNRSLRVQDCDLLSDMIRNHDIPEDAIIAERLAAFKRAGGPDLGRTITRISKIEAMFEAQNEAVFDMFGFDNRLPK